MWGVVSGQGEAREIRFVRDLPHPPEAVWAALITPARIAGWMCATAEVEPYAGGRFHLKFHNFDHTLTGMITRFDPPRALEYTWPETSARGDSLVLWELEALGDGTRLTLTHSLPLGGDLPGFGSGWHWHLDALSHAVQEAAIPWDEPGWRALKAQYDLRFAV